MTDDTTTLDEFPFPGPRTGDGWEWPKDLTPDEASAFLHDTQIAISGLPAAQARKILDDIGCPVCRGAFTTCGHCPEKLLPEAVPEAEAETNPGPDEQALSGEPAPASGPGAVTGTTLGDEQWEQFLAGLRSSMTGINPDHVQGFLDATHCPVCDGNFGRCGHCPADLVQGHQITAGQTAPLPPPLPPGSGYPIPHAPYVAFGQPSASPYVPSRQPIDLSDLIDVSRAPGYQPQPLAPPAPCAGCMARDTEILRLKAELYDLDKELRRQVAILTQTPFGGPRG
jgi:hypothetical protein